MSFSGGQAGLLPTGTPSTIEPNSWIEALDLATREPRPSTSASVSTIWLSRRQAPSPRRGNDSNKVESQVTQTTRRTYEKIEKMWIYTLRSIAPHSNYGSNQTDSHTPHSTSLLLLWVGLDKPYLIAGHIRKNTNDQTDSGIHRHHVKLYPALAYRWHNNGPPMDAHANYGQSTMATLWRHKHQRARPTTTRVGTSPWRPKTP